MAAESRSRARLLREGNAMAKLSHPHVVTVYDVGVDGDRVFLVMELVDGTSLAKWLKAGERRTGEIVRAFLDAGEGLAAAHAAGLVHRDFKPDNVLIGRDGRVQVTDFGLALEVHALPQTAAVGIPGDSVPALSTAAGGTPAYMAPSSCEGSRSMRGRMYSRSGWPSSKPSQKSARSREKT
jgi:serine/threonine protein kinase